ncbi:hypothetical protein RF11_15653 [Thelohanellus kitauei]|uniref:Uncharacterized protein n=1 Tax=Thelohanellus kitauei TaxID=669202 RepID=A0A0C2NA75_THEKT|nr:hypothetical protein RF11_15653 [Thelohanellus kitauei]
MARRNHKNLVCAEITQKLIQTLRMPRWWLLRKPVLGASSLILLAGRQVAIPVNNARLADIRCTPIQTQRVKITIILPEAMPKGMLAIDRRGGRACDSDTPYRRDACIDPLRRLCANLGKALCYLGLSRW